MPKQKSNVPHTLALYVSRYGISHLFFTPDYVLSDFGTANVRAARKHQSTVTIVRKLIQRYMPEVLIVECPAKGRARRHCSLQRSIADIAAKERIPVHSFARLDIQKVGKKWNAANKFELNDIIASAFPTLALRKPEKRKAWETEPYRQGVFDAAALALVYFVRNFKFSPEPPKQEDSEETC
jgi:hypothetical protein